MFISNPWRIFQQRANRILRKWNISGLGTKDNSRKRACTQCTHLTVMYQTSARLSYFSWAARPRHALRIGRTSAPLARKLLVDCPLGTSAFAPRSLRRLHDRDTPDAMASSCTSAMAARWLRQGTLRGRVDSCTSAMAARWLGEGPPRGVLLWGLP